MNKKLFKALKNKYKALGFGDKAFTAVADFLAISVADDAEEADIETAISGVEPLLKSFQKEVDRRVGTVQTELDTIKQTVNKGKGGVPDDEPEPTPSGNPEIAQLTKLISNLASSVNTILEKDKQTSLQQRWADAAKGKGVTNQKLIEKWMPKSEDELEANLEDLVSFNTDFSKEESNQNSHGRPPAGGGGSTGSSKTTTKKGESILDKWASKNQPVTSQKSEV